VRCDDARAERMLRNLVGEQGTVLERFGALRASVDADPRVARVLDRMCAYVVRERG
jgi:hypothetical protein